jgi:hypothetical protein
MFDNSNDFDAWYSLLQSLLIKSKLKKSILTKNHQTESLKSNSFTNSSTSSPSDSTCSISSIKQPHNDNNKESTIHLSNLNLNESVDELTGSISPSSDHSTKLLSNDDLELTLTLSNSLDLNKYLNENDDDLLFFHNGSTTTTKSLNESSQAIVFKNPFDLYQKLESNNSEVINDETELECIWPPLKTNRYLLLECKQLKFNINIPIISAPITPMVTASSIKQKTAPIALNNNKDLEETSNNNNNNNKETIFNNKTFTMNPEVFFVTLSLYDSRNNQKISSNFNWIPDYNTLIKDLFKTINNKIEYQTSTKRISTNSNNSSLFSFDGINLFKNDDLLTSKQINEDELSMVTLFY